MPVLERLLTLSGALAPVFVLIAAGFALRRSRVLTEAGVEDLNRLVYWVALPAQIVVMIADSDIRREFAFSTLVACVLAFIVAMVLIWLATWRLEPSTRGTLISSMVRGNAAFVGLPVMRLVGETLPPAERAVLETAFVVLLAGMVLCFNVGSVVAFLLPQHGISWRGVGRVIKQLARNPIVLSSLLGISLSLIHPHMLSGGVVGNSLNLLAAASIPLALLVTGAQLEPSLIVKRGPLVVAACLGKLVLMPALTYFSARIFGLEHPAFVAAVVLMACPSAVAGGALARILGGNVALMAAIIAATTILAPFTLVLWLALLAP
jgi:predicted permease